MEKILEIKNSGFTQTVRGYKSHYDGYEIITNIQTIQIGISSGQSCCENFGCIITNDDIEEFIGSELKSVSIVDSALNNKKIEDIESLDCGDVMFVNLETSFGLLQFVAYNSHNGYYGHDAVLISNQLNHSVFL